MVMYVMPTSYKPTFQMAHHRIRAPLVSAYLFDDLMTSVGIVYASHAHHAILSLLC